MTDHAQKTATFHRYFLSLHRARLDDGRLAIRYAALANGVGFAATLWLALNCAHGSAEARVSFAAAVIVLGLGATAAMLTSVFAYLANDAAANHRGKQMALGELPAIDDAPGPGVKEWRITAFLFWAVSLVLFLVGAACVARALI